MRDELLVRTIAWVKASSLVLLELAPRLPTEERLPADVTKARHQNTRTVRRAIAEQRHEHLQHRRYVEQVANELHRDDAQPLTPAYGAVDVKGDRLVFALLQRVPEEQVAHGVVAERRLHLLV